MARRRLVTSVARAGSAPVRDYFNAGFEGVKDEVRRLAAEERLASAKDYQGVLVLLDRLQESVGFLGLQLSELRAELDDVRARLDGAEASRERQPDPDAT